MGESVSQHVGCLISQSICRSVSQSVNLSLSQVGSQSVAQTVSQSVSQSVGRSVGQLVGRLVSQSVNTLTVNMEILMPYKETLFNRQTITTPETSNHSLPLSIFTDPENSMNFDPEINYIARLATLESCVCTERVPLDTVFVITEQIKQVLHTHTHTHMHQTHPLEKCLL